MQGEVVERQLVKETQALIFSSEFCVSPPKEIFPLQSIRLGNSVETKETVHLGL